MFPRMSGRLSKAVGRDEVGTKLGQRCIVVKYKELHDNKVFLNTSVYKKINQTL